MLEFPGPRKMVRFLLFINLIFLFQLNGLAKETLFRHGLRDTGEVALTFDDGPHPLYTPLLLKILKSRGILATFFVVGERVQQFPALADRMAQEGHELGNHGFSHKNMTGLSLTEVHRELEKTFVLIKMHTGQKVHLFRPPGGQYNRAILKCIEGMGYTMVLWEINPSDWKTSSEDILRRVGKSIKPGDIILLHDGSMATLNALPPLIDYIQEKGLRFVTVGALRQRVLAKEAEQKRKETLALVRKKVKLTKDKGSSLRAYEEIVKLERSEKK